MNKTTTTTPTTYAPTHNEVFEASKAAMVDALREKGRMTSSELYAECTFGQTWNIGPVIAALDVLVKDGRVTERWEQGSKGKGSTNTHTLA